ncbi:MAG: hypothetical protein JF588_14835 [Caulobacterales bacterium]|nr:hypothetical protein [Caulobacterales bacterium]
MNSGAAVKLSAPAMAWDDSGAPASTPISTPAAEVVERQNAFSRVRSRPREATSSSGRFHSASRGSSDFTARASDGVSSSATPMPAERAGSSRVAAAASDSMAAGPAVARVSQALTSRRRGESIIR